MLEKIVLSVFLVAILGAGLFMAVAPLLWELGFFPFMGVYNR